MEQCSKQPHKAENISSSNEEDIIKKAKKKEVNSKKYGASFKYKVPFKSEWKVNFPIKEKSCYHKDLGDCEYIVQQVLTKPMLNHKIN